MPRGVAGRAPPESARKAAPAKSSLLDVGRDKLLTIQLRKLKPLGGAEQVAAGDPGRVMDVDQLQVLGGRLLP